MPHASTHSEDNRGLTTHSKQLAQGENRSDWFTEAVSNTELPKPSQEDTPPKEHFIISDELKEHYEAIITRRDNMLAEPELYKDTDITAMLNATTKMLQALVATQERLYNAETFAKFQHAVIDTLKSIDQELANKILEKIENELKNLED